MKVYIAPEVADVEALHPYLSDEAFRSLPIREQLEHQAKTIQAAHAADDRRVLMHLMSWYPAASGHSADEMMEISFGRDDARLTIAREYGFADWERVQEIGVNFSDPEFENTLDELLSGNFNALRHRLDRAPDLAKRPSVFGHKATLLHYIAANGVESHRQKVPLNAPDLARLLIGHGADIAAEAEMYGGGQTALSLSKSSAHPLNAGVAAELKQVLSGN